MNNNSGRAIALIIAAVASTNAEAAGHCTAEETTYFSCTVVKSSKVISLCGGSLEAVIAGAPKSEFWLQYRFGSLGKVELAYPEKRSGSLNRFSFDLSQSNGAHNYSTSFKNKAATYSIEWMAGTDEPKNQFFGVSISENGGFQQLPCRGTPEHEFASWSPNFSSLVVLGHEEARPAR